MNWYPQIHPIRHDPIPGPNIKLRCHQLGRRIERNVWRGSISVDRLNRCNEQRQIDIVQRARVCASQEDELMRDGIERGSLYVFQVRTHERGGFVDKDTTWVITTTVTAIAQKVDDGIK